MPLAACLDTLGVIARHVEDLALMLQFLAGRDPRDASAAHVPVPDYLATLDAPVKGLRVGLDAKVAGEAHPDVQAILRKFPGAEILNVRDLEAPKPESLRNTEEPDEESR